MPDSGGKGVAKQGQDMIAFFQLLYDFMQEMIDI